MQMERRTGFVAARSSDRSCGSRGSKMGAFLTTKPERGLAGHGEGNRLFGGRLKKNSRTRSKSTMRKESRKGPGGLVQVSPLERRKAQRSQTIRVKRAAGAGTGWAPSHVERDPLEGRSFRDAAGPNQLNSGRSSGLAMKPGRQDVWRDGQR